MGTLAAFVLSDQAYGWFALLGGMMLHLLARVRAKRIDTTASRL